jgi:hypothetical protein
MTDIDMIEDNCNTSPGSISTITRTGFFNPPPTLSAIGQSSLNDFIKLMNTIPNFQLLEINIYVDNQADFNANQQEAIQQANVISSYLSSKGVNMSKVQINPIGQRIGPGGPILGNQIDFIFHCP